MNLVQQSRIKGIFAVKGNDRPDDRTIQLQHADNVDAVETHSL